MDQNLIDKFKNREVKAKEVFNVKQIGKTEAYEFVRKYHYLKDAKFFSAFAYGLFQDKELVGVATYSNPQGSSSLKGWFGLTNEDNSILELSRLCMLPILNGSNATSYLLGNSIKELKKEGIRAIITLADSGNHVGSIYQVCNFKYYGLTDVKTDFIRHDGKVNPRGSTKDVEGVWLPRTRKHRYCYVIDKELIPRYDEVERFPKKGDTIELECCGGTLKVYDKRFNKTYTCPRCCREFKELENEVDR